MTRINHRVKTKPGSHKTAGVQFRRSARSDVFFVFLVFWCGFKVFLCFLHNFDVFNVFLCLLHYFAVSDLSVPPFTSLGVLSSFKAVVFAVGLFGCLPSKIKHFIFEGGGGWGGVVPVG